MNNKGSSKPRPASGGLAQQVVLSVALLALAGCGGGGGGEGGTPSSMQTEVVSFPVTPDTYEGTSGDNTQAEAGTLTIGTTQSRTLFPAGDEDWVKVTLTAGKQYEFSTNKLNYTGDTELFLFESGNTTTPVASNDDYISLDSRFTFTPTVSGTYYLKVSAADVTNDDQLEVVSYVLGARVFSDKDGDSFSPYYDCNDGRSDIHPWALETPGDGIDQDCSGADAPSGNKPDLAENDDTIDTARVMAPVTASPFEPMVERVMHLANKRSLTPDGDMDFFSIEVPANGAIEIDLADEDVTVRGTLFGSNKVQIGVPETFPYFYVVNTDSAPKKIYVKYEADVAGTSGYYIPFYADLGVDLDRDTFYTQDWVQVRDCNDADASIHPSAGDSAGDGIDQNCDGVDGMAP